MKVLTITLWVLLFFILKNTKFVICVGICRENEQRALETLKKEIHDPSDIPSSWIVGKDCCEWEGVVCNNLSRHVIELHLGYVTRHEEIGRGMFFDRLEFTYPRINSLEWLPSLSSLENLQMVSVDLSKVNEWLQVINMLPSLVDLRLSSCSLHHITPLLDHHNFSSLKFLDLSFNYKLSSSVPKWVFNLPNLIFLDLSYCNFTSPFPDGPVNLTSLTTFKASGNFFNCRLPKWLFDFNNLEHLELSSNMLSGKLPNVIGKLGKLEYLDLSYNQFEGDIPISVTRLAGLRSFNLSKNNLTGRIPNDIGDMKVLKTVDLSENQLYGQIPQSFSSLPTLSYLNLSDNNLSGMIPVSTQLQSFDSTSFQGNKLCGLPLLVNCSSDGNIPNNKHEDDESDKDEVDWFYISMAIGFALSFWGVCGSLFLRGHGDMLIFVCMLTFLMLAIMLFHCIFK
uniref:Serine-threonine protein kinase, plant-type n=2 Tax=Solanum tuberosum TaxID=4113 RepID=M1B6H4_SOLTU